MKENKGKDTQVEGSRPETQAHPHPSAREKRKALSKNLDLGSLPSRRGKKGKHDSQIVKPNLPPSQQPTQVFDVDSSIPVDMTPSKTPPPRTTVSTSSQRSQKASSNIIENEDLAWECFQNAILDEDIYACYDMSLKEFKHSSTLR